MEHLIHKIEIKDSIGGIYNIIVYMLEEDYLNVKNIFENRTRLLDISDINSIFFYETFFDGQINVKISDKILN